MICPDASSLPKRLSGRSRVVGQMDLQEFSLRHASCIGLMAMLLLAQPALAQTRFQLDQPKSHLSVEPPAERKIIEEINSAFRGHQARLLTECDKLASDEWDRQRLNGYPGREWSDAEAAKPAVEACERAAKNKNRSPRHLYQLGRALAVQSLEAARPHFEAAAAEGHLGAMSYLADMYRLGTGVARDDDKAVRLATAAAEGGGDVRGMVILSALLRRPERPVEDHKKGLEWLLRSAQAGFPEAMRRAADLVGARDWPKDVDPSPFHNVLRELADRGELAYQIDLGEKIAKGVVEERRAGEMVALLSLARTYPDGALALSLLAEARSRGIRTQQDDVAALLDAYGALDLLRKHPSRRSHVILEHRIGRLIVGIIRGGKVQPRDVEEYRLIERDFSGRNHAAYRVTLKCEGKAQAGEIELWDWGRDEPPTRPQFEGFEARDCKPDPASVARFEEAFRLSRAKGTSMEAEQDALLALAGDGNRAADADRSAAALAQCDALAASPNDHQRPKDIKGVEADSIDVPTAIEACTEALKSPQASARHRFQLGRALAVKGDDLAARHHFDAAAAAGHILAKTQIGMNLRRGQGTPVDHKEARRLLAEAAEAGNALAMIELGAMHRDGEGGPVDFLGAKKWFQEALKAGSVISDRALAEVFADPRYPGGANLPAAAFHWRRMVGRGDVGAAILLGEAILQGQVPTESRREFEELLSPLAEQGSATATYLLALGYRSGRGVRKDIDKSLALAYQALDLHRRAKPKTWNAKPSLLFRIGSLITALVKNDQAKPRNDAEHADIERDFSRNGHSWRIRVRCGPQSDISVLEDRLYVWDWSRDVSPTDAQIAYFDDVLGCKGLGHLKAELEEVFQRSRRENVPIIRLIDNSLNSNSNAPVFNAARDAVFSIETLSVPDVSIQIPRRSGLEKHAISFGAPPKYPAGFTRFDWAAKDAERDGVLRIGTRLAVPTERPKPGIQPKVGNGLLYETLLFENPEEKNVFYGFLAKTVERTEDDQGLILELNSEAYFESGDRSSIRALDVIRSFESWMHGRQAKLRPVSMKEISKSKIAFDFGQRVTAEHARLLANVPIAASSTAEGTGPYRFVRQFEAEIKVVRGKDLLDERKRIAVFERRDGYWGARGPYGTGLNNFAAVHFVEYDPSDLAEDAGAKALSLSRVDLVDFTGGRWPTDAEMAKSYDPIHFTRSLIGRSAGEHRIGEFTAGPVLHFSHIDAAAPATDALHPARVWQSARTLPDGFRRMGIFDSRTRVIERDAALAKTTGPVPSPSRDGSLPKAGWLGVTLSDAKGGKGIVLDWVHPASPVRGVLGAGDVITAIDGTEVSNAARLRRLIASRGAGAVIAIGFRHTDGTSRHASVQLAPFPSVLQMKIVCGQLETKVTVWVAVDEGWATAKGGAFLVKSIESELQQKKCQLPPGVADTIMKKLAAIPVSPFIPHVNHLAMVHDSITAVVKTVDPDARINPGTFAEPLNEFGEGTCARRLFAYSCTNWAEAIGEHRDLLTESSWREAAKGDLSAIFTANWSAFLAAGEYYIRNARMRVAMDRIRASYRSRPFISAEKFHSDLAEAKMTCTENLGGRFYRTELFDEVRNVCAGAQKETNK